MLIKLNEGIPISIMTKRREIPCSSLLPCWYLPMPEAARGCGIKNQWEDPFQNHFLLRRSFHHWSVWRQERQRVETTEPVHRAFTKTILESVIAAWVDGPVDKGRLHVKNEPNISKVRFVKYVIGRIKKHKVVKITCSSRRSISILIISPPFLIFRASQKLRRSTTTVLEQPPAF